MVMTVTAAASRTETQAPRTQHDGLGHGAEVVGEVRAAVPLGAAEGDAGRGT